MSPHDISSYAFDVPQKKRWHPHWFIAVLLVSMGWCQYFNLLHFIMVLYYFISHRCSLFFCFCWNLISFPCSLVFKTSSFSVNFFRLCNVKKLFYKLILQWIPAQWVENWLKFQVQAVKASEMYCRLVAQVTIRGWWKLENLKFKQPKN